MKCNFEGGGSFYWNTVTNRHFGGVRVHSVFTTSLPHDTSEKGKNGLGPVLEAEVLAFIH